MKKFLAGVVVVGLGFMGTVVYRICRLKQNRLGRSSGCGNTGHQ